MLCGRGLRGGGGWRTAGGGSRCAAVRAVCDGVVVLAVDWWQGRDVLLKGEGGGVCAVAVVTRVAVGHGLGGGEGAGVQEAAAKYTCRDTHR